MTIHFFFVEFLSKRRTAAKLSRTASPVDIVLVCAIKLKKVFENNFFDDNRVVLQN